MGIFTKGVSGAALDVSDIDGAGRASRSAGRDPDRPQRSRTRAVQGAALAVALLFGVAAPAAAEPGPAETASSTDRVPQVGNPYLPLWEHVPDGEPDVFEDPDNPGQYRVYIYGSHDTRRTAHAGYDIVAWSAPVDNLSDWRYDGIAYSAPTSGSERGPIYAPDVVKRGDTYYLYAPHNSDNYTRVSTSSSPAGPFTNPVRSSIRFDPTVLVDDDGRAYVYWGGSGASSAAELESDMVTIKPGTQVNNMIPNPAANPQWGFYEASSIRKIGNKYVLVWAKQTGSWANIGIDPDASIGQLVYAYSDNPLGPWTLGNTIIDAGGERVTDPATGAVFKSYPNENTHGGLVQVEDQWYIFYHRQTNQNGYTRQGMMEPVSVTVDEAPVSQGGRVVIPQAEVTSQGPNADGLDAYRRLSAGYASYLTRATWKSGPYIQGVYNPYPYGAPEASAAFANYYENTPILGIVDGTVAGFKYLQFGETAQPGAALRARFTPRGEALTVTVMLDSPTAVGGGTQIAQLAVPADAPKGGVVLEADVPAITGKHAVYFVFRSVGAPAGQSLVEFEDFVFVHDASVNEPDAPAKPLVKGTDGDLVVTWTAPFDGGSPLTGYTVTALPATGTPVVREVPAGTTSVTFEGLGADATWTARVAATNALGTSMPSRYAEISEDCADGVSSRTVVCLSGLTTSSVPPAGASWTYAYNASLGTMLVSVTGADVRIAGTATIPLSIDTAAAVKSLTLDGASWESPATGFTPLSTTGFTLNVVGDANSSIKGGTYGIWARANVAIDNSGTGIFTLEGTTQPTLNATSGKAELLGDGITIKSTNQPGILARDAVSIAADNVSIQSAGNANAIGVSAATAPVTITGSGVAIASTGTGGYGLVTGRAAVVGGSDVTISGVRLDAGGSLTAGARGGVLRRGLTVADGIVCGAANRVPVTYAVAGQAGGVYAADCVAPGATIADPGQVAGSTGWQTASVPPVPWSFASDVVTAALVLNPVSESPAVEGLLARYTFDDGTLHDEVGTAHLTASGTAVVATDAAQGKALRLDGSTNGFASFPTGFFDGRNTMTIAMDVKSELTSGNFFTFGIGQSDQKYYFLRVRGADVRSAITKASWNTESAVTGTVTSGAWHRYHLVFEGSKMTVYVDGVKLGENAALNTTIGDLGTGLSAYLGKSFYSGDRYFQGWFDNVEVYDRALTPADMIGHSQLADISLTQPDLLRHQPIVDDAARTAVLPVKKGTDLTTLAPTFTAAPGVTVSPASGTVVDLSSPITYTLTAPGGATATWTLDARIVASPVLPGLYADPNIAVFGDTYYIYATTDGYASWAGKDFYVWKSKDLVEWERSEQPFLTLDGANGNVPWATGSAWAPTIVERDGKYYFYFSGHNPTYNRKTIGVAVADHPEGPFTAQPTAMIVNNEEVTVGQAIDPAAFRDPATGKYYLIWGNAGAILAELNDDMVSLKAGSLQKLSGLTGLSEGPFLNYRDGLYHLTYAVDDTRSENYRVGYATATDIRGPWTYRGVILEKDLSLGIKGTGHSSVLNVPGTDDWYIAYHRFAIP
ncbi:MAG TPA: family 43 glycosylhydrolase, partial [Arachnia sp.]|nr:family 43 glycosylhydrolase [Arachnia sp.]